jgi:flagellar biosynthesis/type III secretory pathway protein FliH
VINQTPEQNELYSSRQKFLLDEASRLDSTRRDALKEGREEGRQKGRQKGRQEGRIELIQTLQRLLNIPKSTVEELSENDDARLIEMSDELQRQLRVRGE